jgi:hypothetical protein
VQHVADPVDGDVGGGVAGHGRRVAGVVALPDEYRRDALVPVPLHGGQDAQLVVHHEVGPAGEPRFHLAKLPLLVDVNEDVAADGVPQARPHDLTRLETQRRRP